MCDRQLNKIQKVYKNILTTQVNYGYFKLSTQ
jgi:hypothetical protein